MSDKSSVNTGQGTGWGWFYLYLWGLYLYLWGLYFWGLFLLMGFVFVFIFMEFKLYSDSCDVNSWLLSCAGSPQTWKRNKPQEFCCTIWGFGLKPWPKISWGRLFALEFQQLCYLSRGSSAVPELLWVCELPVPPPWCQWQKQGEETKAEPQSAKSILFQKILIFSQLL